MGSVEKLASACVSSCKGYRYPDQESSRQSFLFVVFLFFSFLSFRTFPLPSSRSFFSLCQNHCNSSFSPVSPPSERSREQQQHRTYKRQKGTIVSLFLSTDPSLPYPSQPSRYPQRSSVVPYRPIRLPQPQRVMQSL